MSNHRKRTEYEEYIIPNSFRVRYQHSRQQVALNPRFELEMQEIGAWEMTSPPGIHIDKSDLYKLFYVLKRDFDVIDIKYATDYIELNAEFLN
ncbi:TPA: hypothetical protein ACGUQA_000722 [Vibrio vulnificus]